MHRLPAPGPLLAALVLTACGGEQAAPLPCGLFTESELPGVRFGPLSQACTFTVAQAKAGLDLPFQVVVDNTLEDVGVPLNPYFCGGPVPSGLWVSSSISGAGQRWAPSANGFCDVSAVPPVRVERGLYQSYIHWDGRNFVGEGDSPGLQGPPFPPGIYLLELRSQGTYSGRDFVIRGTMPVELVP